ncbi:MAG TPA: methionyl-tRNA formyltransferase [Deltaproteobacteria bacterium]|nr:methionyl-tRNA formyltransferase [Deltaproteobacteria bacterium]
MGSPDIAVPGLRALHEAGHEILAVVTQPDRPKGRGQSLTPPPVKEAASSLGLKILQPEKIKMPEFAAALRALHPDFLIVVAYGKILPKEILQIPEIAPINLHFSLLPRYRGASCVAAALLNGDEESGVTTIFMDEGLDSGPILLQWSEPIAAEDSAGSLARRLSELGAKALLQTIAGIEQGRIQPTPQDAAAATQVPLLKKEDGRIDWSESAAKILNRYRALTPWPGVFSFLGGKRIVLTELKPSPTEVKGVPGQILWNPNGILQVACGEGSLEIVRLKPEGKSVLSAADFMRGWRQKEGLCFD